MELRLKATLVFLGIALGAAAQNAGMSYAVRHQHLRKGGEGMITFTADGVSFRESGKMAEHSRVWRYEEIQRLELGPEELRIVTYEDVNWRLGKDREYLFDRLPRGMAAALYPNLYARMDQRLVARLADAYVEPLWEAPVKMKRGFGGVSGVLKAGPDRVVFEAARLGESRTWRYEDVRNISAPDPFELAVTSLDGEVRFQLKQALPEDRFNDLWRRIQEANGLKTFHSQLKD